MSKFTTAFNYMLANEGGYSDDPSDRGGCTKYGLTLADVLLHPVDIHNCADLKRMDLNTARAIFHMDYWKFEQINDVNVATKMFDIYVNLPPGSAYRLFQRAANNCGAALTVDGILGEKSISVINKLSPKQYLAELVDQLHEYYQAVVRARPSQAVFLKGWLTRADRLPNEPTVI